MTRDIYSWLERLPIPQYAVSLGRCSLCVETDEPCEVVRIAYQMEIADSKESQDHWKQALQAGNDPNGLCLNTPAVKKTIIVLCSYDGQSLAKALVERFTEQDRVNFAAENQARFGSPVGYHFEGLGSKNSFYLRDAGMGI